MTDDQSIKCNVAIHTAAAAAAAIGAGLAQLPGSDNVPLVAVQITMAIALGSIFDIQVTDTVARGMIITALTSMTGPVIARTISQWVVGWLPGAGNAVNAATAASGKNKTTMPRKDRNDMRVDTHERKHGLPAGTIRNREGRDTRGDKRLRSIQKEATRGKKKSISS